MDDSLQRSAPSGGSAVSETLERRATTTAAVAGLVAALNSGVGFAVSFGLATAHVVIYVATLAALVASISLALLIIAPDHPLLATIPERALLLFFAQAAFAVAILLLCANGAWWAAVEALGDENPFG